MQLSAQRVIAGKKVMLKSLGNEDQIALAYFYRLIDEAVASIKTYGSIADFLEDWHESESEDDYPIGFDEYPKELAVANATILKGEY